MERPAAARALTTPRIAVRASAPATGYSFALAGRDDDSGIRRLLRDTEFPGDVRIAFEREPDALSAACLGRGGAPDDRRSSRNRLRHRGDRDALRSTAIRQWRSSIQSGISASCASPQATVVTVACSTPGSITAGDCIRTMRRACIWRAWSRTMPPR